MFGYSSFEMGLLILLGSFCIFTILNRICSCVEHCFTARAIGKMNIHDLNIKQEDMEKYFNGQPK